MRLHEILTESLQDWDAGNWVHFSDHDMLTINAKPFHQDPLGIYFFPASFKPKTSMWANKKHRFTVKLANGARVLDYGATTDEQLADLLGATKATAEFERSIARYEPKDRRDMLSTAWSEMRQSMMFGEGRGAGDPKAAWNRALRQLGWDAIFDDTGSIHSSEVQMLVLNPRIIRPVEMAEVKSNVFAAMTKVMADLQKACAPYGHVTVEEPRKRKERFSNASILMAEVRVTQGEHSYAYFTIRNDPQDRHQKHKVTASLTYSMPSLGYGFSVEYDMQSGSYRPHSDMASVEDAMTNIFRKAA